MDPELSPEQQEITPGSPEYDALMADKFDQQTGDTPSAEKTSEEPTPEERPSWLPEKFKSPEDLAKAYDELQRKLSSGEKPDASQPETKTDEPTQDEVKAAVDSAGLDFDALSTEFSQNGDISTESREALVKAGYGEDLIDNYLEGQRAIMQLNRMEIFNEVGGEDAYAAMTTWAASALSDAEINAYNEAVDSGDKAKIKLAVAGLKAKFEGANGSEPNLINGGTGQMSGDVFRSTAELTAAMRDPRYKTDPAYRADVQSKLARSNNVF